MATTIKRSFVDLRRNLEITDLQASTVSTRQTNVRAVIEDEMIILDSFLVGSYQQNTMIAPLKTADAASWWRCSRLRLPSRRLAARRVRSKRQV